MDYKILLIFMVIVGTLVTSGCTQDGQTGTNDTVTDDVPFNGEAVSVSELLSNPVYDKDIKIYGEVDQLGELLCSCFSLYSEGGQVQVWYDTMVDEEMEWTQVNVEGIENGDQIVVTGRLKDTPSNDFWSLSVVKTEEPEEIEITREEALNMATQFVENSPTYKFDGSDLEVIRTENVGCEDCWTFGIRFSSSNSGYGDRTDEILTQYETVHEAVISVEGGEVVAAIIDGRWDIITQNYVDA
ncbi:MAG: hypothetical protein ABIH52_02000 [Candidatus Aenigmatarchaeota archaeon]|nr:hypothetical protein [Nanoarchaeota archaeon]